MSTSSFSVNRETCSKCGACIEVCPASVIAKDESGIPFFREDYTEICIGCGQCMAVCRTKSVFADQKNYEEHFFGLSDSADLFSIFEHRRSVRRFRPKPVEKELLKKILYAISLAPHGDKEHHIEVTVINGREKILGILPSISEFYDKLGKMLRNPIGGFIIRRKVGKDMIKTLYNHLLPRIEKGIYRNITEEYDGITRGAHTLMVFHAPEDAPEHKEDAFIFVTYAALAAQSLGLGATIVGLIPPAINRDKNIKKLFNIPDNHEAVTSVILGYPKYKYHRGIKREIKAVHWID